MGCKITQKNRREDAKSHNWQKYRSKSAITQKGRLPCLYLGLPIGGDPRKLQFWYPLVDRIRERLSGLKCKNLSLGGRLVLLKSVMSFVPVYFLCFFKAPSSIISSLDSIFSNFFWGGGEDVSKISWIKWDNICLQTENGGLG